MPKVIDACELTFMVKVDNGPASRSFDRKAVDDPTKQNPDPDNPFFVVFTTSLRMSDMQALNAHEFQLRLRRKRVPLDGIQSEAGCFLVLNVEVSLSVVRLPACRVPVLPSSGMAEQSQPPCRSLRVGDTTRVQNE